MWLCFRSMICRKSIVNIWGYHPLICTVQFCQMALVGIIFDSFFSRDTIKNRQLWSAVFPHLSLPIDVTAFDAIFLYCWVTLCFLLITDLPQFRKIKAFAECSFVKFRLLSRRSHIAGALQCKYQWQAALCTAVRVLAYLPELLTERHQVLHWKGGRQLEKELDVLTVYSRLFVRDIVAMVCLLQSGDHLSCGGHNIACVGRAVLWNAVAVHLRSLCQEKGGSSRFPNFPSPHAVYCSNACSATQVMHNMGRVQFYRGVGQGGREAGKIFFCSKPL